MDPTNPHARFFSCAAVQMAAAVALSCGGAPTGDAAGGSSAADTLPKFQLSLTPLPATVIEGGTANIAIRLTRLNGYTGAVTFAATALPNGLTAAFNPATLSGSLLSSTLTITAAVSAPASPNALMGLTATGPDVVDTLSFPIIIAQPRLTVSRTGSGTGTVTSSPAGISCGGTCSAGFAPGTSVTLTATVPAGSAFAGWSGACSGSSVSCVVTTNVASTDVVATFTSTAPSFTMSLSANGVSVPQGGSDAITATITRVNGFAGAVSLAFSGVPSGLTVAANPSSITGTTASVAFSASPTLAAASYPVTVTATGAGVAQQTGTIVVQVTPGAGGSGNVAYSFASCDPSQVPIWFAVQSGSGPWTRVTPGAGSTFAFTPGATEGVAYVIQVGTGFVTTVTFGSASDITAIATGRGPCGADPPTGTKVLKGTVANNGATLPTSVSIGASDTTFFGANGPNFSLETVPAGTHDLLARYSILNTDNTTTSERLIIRRNINYANNGTIPLLDFASPEGFMGVLALDTLVNVGTDQTSGRTSLITANGPAGAFFTGIGSVRNGTNIIRTFALPDSMLQAGDVQVRELDAVPQGSSTSSRSVFLMRQSAVGQTFTFGPALATPTVTSLGSAPYLRLRAQLASQSAYNGGVLVQLDQRANAVTVAVTAGYTASAPASWVIDVPDLSAAGYSAAWGLQSGAALSWTVAALGGNILPFFGGATVEGAQMTAGSMSSPGSGVTFRRGLLPGPRQR